MQAHVFIDMFDNSGALSCPIHQIAVKKGRPRSAGSTRTQYACCKVTILPTHSQLWTDLLYGKS